MKRQEHRRVQCASITISGPRCSTSIHVRASYQVLDLPTTTNNQRNLVQVSQGSPARPPVCLLLPTNPSLVFSVPLCRAASGVSLRISAPSYLACYSGRQGDLMAGPLHGFALTRPFHHDKAQGTRREAPTHGSGVRLLQAPQTEGETFLCERCFYLPLHYQRACCSTRLWRSFHCAACVCWYFCLFLYVGGVQDMPNAPRIRSGQCCSVTHI